MSFAAPRGRSGGADTGTARGGAPEGGSGKGVLAVGGLIFVGLAAGGLYFLRSSAPPASPPVGIDLGLRRDATPPPLADDQSTGPGGAAYGRGRSLLAQGDGAGAAAAFREAVQAEPGKALYHLGLAQALAQSGATDESLSSYAEAARLDPKTQGTKYARALEVAGRTDEAIAALTSLVGQDPAPEYVSELGRLYFDSQDYEKALPLLKQMADSSPQDREALDRLAYAQNATGDQAQAVETYRQLLSLQPDLAGPRASLAEALVGQGRQDEGISLLKEGIAMQPRIPVFHRSLGSILERAGKNADAAAAYTEYAKLAPSAPDAREIAARAARLSGRTP